MKIKFTESLVIATGLILGITILMISLMRVTLDKAINDERLGQFREVPIVVGGKEIYKLPYSGKLPGEGLYFLKKIRNWGWEILSRKEQTKIELNLILADKKMSEAWTLFNQTQKQRALTAGSEAVDKLEYAHQLWRESGIDQESQERLQEKITEKKEVYKEILESWEKQ